jgi:hypothetical protein
MPLRARVGRHAKTGAQCQNWVEDQLKVIMQLNFIPAADGGAEASLNRDRLIAGISSDALCNAILRFQKQHFPAQQSGFVEPGGGVFARMEMLALRPPAAPKAAGQWGEFQSGSVERALQEALKEDPQLSQVKVVDILHSTLSNGTVSTSELADLQMVADKSRSIMPRSKTMLELFVKEAKSKRSALGPYKLATSGHINAADGVCDFLKRVGRGQWPTLDRDAVGVGMLMRLAYPGLLQQGEASLCGPAAFLFVVLQDRPGSYAGFAIDMYERGTAHLGGLSITPRDVVRQYSPPSFKIDPVDWVTMASLRDSENWFCAYDTADKTFQGATTPFELVWWFNKAGYSDVKDDFNLVRHQRDGENMDEASRLFSAGYRVCLLIDYQMIETQHQAESGSMADRHWVVLRSRIDRSGGNVKMTIFTWGDGNRQVPQSGVLRLDDFLENYYGYVAGKP